MVRQSGNSAGANLRISKRGLPYARRCFYILALQSVSLRKNGEPKNHVLRTYYLEKCKSKAKMTALGAIMHKLCIGHSHKKRPLTNRAGSPILFVVKGWEGKQYPSPSASESGRWVKGRAEAGRSGPRAAALNDLSKRRRPPR